MRGHGDGGEGIRNRGCSCTKDDVLPEESFRTKTNYVRAIFQIPIHFRDRLLTRSLDSIELNEIKSQSEHEMKKNFTWWDLMWFGVGAVVGAGIFVLTGPVVVLSYVVSVLQPCFLLH